MNQVKQPKHKITDIVYLDVPGGEEFKIVNIIYNYSDKKHEYQLMDFNGEKKWFEEHEITTEKTIKL